MPRQDFSRLLLSLFFMHTHTTTAIQKRAAAIRKARDFARVDLMILAVFVNAAPDIFVKDSLISVSNADNRIAVFFSTANDRAQTGVHTRCVAAAAQHANLHFIYTPMKNISVKRDPLPLLLSISCATSASCSIQQNAINSPTLQGRRGFSVVFAFVGRFKSVAPFKRAVRFRAIGRVKLL